MTKKIVKFTFRSFDTLHSSKFPYFLQKQVRITKKYQYKEKGVSFR